MTPRPPALVTAAASSGPAATFIPVVHRARPSLYVSTSEQPVDTDGGPARRMGCLMPKSLVSGVEMVAMLNEEYGMWRGEGEAEMRCPSLLSSDSADLRQLGNPNAGGPAAERACSVFRVPCSVLRGEWFAFLATT